MSRYHDNKADAVTFNNEPTKTDQSQAQHTDINVIVNQFLRTGQAPAGQTPLYGDFSELPKDTRGFIEMGRSINTLKNRLPAQLQDIPTDVLFKMTTAEINAKLAPPEPKTKEQT